MENAKHKLPLKELALDIKNRIVTDENLDVESYVRELSERTLISIDDIRNMYNNLFSIVNIEPTENRKRQPWHQSEDNLISEFVRLSREKDKRVSVIFILKELADILDNRTETAINYRYYNVLMKPKERKKSQKRKYAKRATKDKIEKGSHNPAKKLIIQNHEQSDSEDLLSMIVEIIDNVEMADVDVSSLFKSLLILSRKAVKNADKEELEQLRKEKIEMKEDIKNLTKDMHLLKREFENFNKMDGKEKIRNIQNLTNRVNYIVDGRGGVSVKEWFKKQSNNIKFDCFTIDIHNK